MVSHILSRPSRHSLVLFFVLGLLAVIVGVAHIYVWRFMYNSDYAMIGLFAKRILETGEQYLVVPQVGYQGLLFEANFVALMFKLFGISPVVLNFVPFLVFLGFCFFFFNAVKAWHGSNGSHVAWISTFLVILSGPAFNGLILRTQPNYGETYLMGSALFWIYRIILDEGLGRGPSVRTLRLALLFGLIAGYGVYTYGQIFLFIGAIGAHLGLLALQKCLPILAVLKKGRNAEDPIDRAIWKYLRFLSVGFVLIFICFVFSWEKAQIFGKVIKWSADTGVLAFYLGLMGLPVFARMIQGYWKNVKSWIPSFSAFFLAFVIGVSPKLYFHLVQHGHTLSKMNLDGTLMKVYARFRYLILGHKVLLNFTPGVSLSIIATVTVLFCFCKFGMITYQKCRNFINENYTNSEWMAITPFMLFPVVIIGAFIAVNSVNDIFSIRYALTLVFVYAVAIALIVDKFLTEKKWTIQKALIALGIVSVVLNNSRAIYHSLANEAVPYRLEPIAEYLDSKGLKYGYGDYWYSYALTFLTKERIIIEPIYSNYIPFYLETVKPQKRIAYLDRKPDLSIGTTLSFYGNQYKILEMKVINEINVFTLEKI